MFEPLFARLADHYHLIAPDFPGFGHSDWPDPKKFAYTFEHFAEIMNHFTEALGLSRYTFYLQDYGGPVGLRMAMAHPERIEALIIQDAVGAQRRAGGELEGAPGLLGRSGGEREHAARESHVARHDAHPPCRERSLRGAAMTRISGRTNRPSSYRPGQVDIQSQLFDAYRTNVEAYRLWQAWQRKTQPRLLGSGADTTCLQLSEPEAYRRDVPGPKRTSSTPATLRSTRMRMKSRGSSESS